MRLVLFLWLGLLAPWFGRALGAAEDAASERVAHVTAALARAKETGSDIAVLQRGSDWNRLGETLYRNLWMQDGLLTALGGGFVLVAVDLPESPGPADVPAALNKPYTWWDATHCPRIALLDRQGRAVACDNAPRSSLTIASLADRLRGMRDLRRRRDALWAKADQAAGGERAELLRQGLDLLGFANWEGNGKCYKPIHDAIRTADPADQSGAVRWLTFGPDPRDGLGWQEPRWSKALDTANPGPAEFTEALARIDRERQDPRNRLLDAERRQRILIAKYTVYTRWKGHEGQRFDVQREIAAIDPGTFWGIGARGDLAMHHLTPMPMLTYGWGGAQVNAGVNAWDLADTAYLFDHAGPYTLTLRQEGGKDPLTIRRIAVLAGATVLTEVQPDTDLSPAHATLPVTLDLSRWTPGTSTVLHIDAVAGTGHTDNRGSFTLEPLLPPPRTPAAMPRIDGGNQPPSTESAVTERRRQLADRLETDPAALAEYTLIGRCGTATVAEIAQAEGGAAFLQELCADGPWLESFLASGPAAWPAALRHLATLHRVHGPLKEPFERRLATALALQWGKGLPYRLVERFRQMREAWQEGLLHRGAERLDVRELRLAVPTAGTTRDYQFLLDDRQMRWKDYLTAHRGIRYLKFNVYGVSVQDGWNYIGPWAHALGSGSGQNSFLIHRQVGGVCGALSNYAVATAQAHGIPSMTIGQPGHCAFIVRVGEEWPVGNSVTWPSTVTAPGWPGTSYATMTGLYEAVNQDRAAALAAQRLEWLAQARTERKDARWAATYEQAIQAQPGNYPIWLAYVTALEARPETGATTWLDLAQRGRTAFAGHGEAAWALTRRCLDHVLPGMTPAARAEVLLACHQDLREERWLKRTTFPFDAVLDWQAKRIADPAVLMDLFGKLLPIHHSPKGDRNYLFGSILAWGGSTLAKNPKTAADYAATIGEFFAQQGKAMNKAQLATTLGNGLGNAGMTGDLTSYRLWSDMAARFLPPLQPRDVHLTPKQAAAAPQVVPFPGEPVSRDGLLQISSANPDNRPLSYPRLLDGQGFGGWFDTGSDRRPWAQVHLAGTCTLTGIVLVGRFEQPPQHEAYQAAPLRVSVSGDGQDWTEVATFTHDDMVFRIDLGDRGLQARYIRAERLSEEGKTFERFHLRRFVVYGNRPQE